MLHDIQMCGCFQHIYNSEGDYRGQTRPLRLRGLLLNISTQTRTVKSTAANCTETSTLKAKWTAFAIKSKLYCCFICLLNISLVCVLRVPPASFALFRYFSVSNENDEDIDLDTWIPPDADLIQKMVSQIEYYLSDENLTKDAFLLKHVRRNKMGYVNIKLLTSFKKVSWCLVLKNIFFLEQHYKFPLWLVFIILFLHDCLVYLAKCIRLFSL